MICHSSICSRAASLWPMLDKIKLNKKWVMVLAALGLVFAGGLVFFILRLNRLVGEEKGRQEAASRVDAAQARLRAPATDGLTAFLDASDVRATAALGGVRYLATSGGLVQLDPSGGVKRRYTTFDGLPGNDLTALAVFQGKLFIGTGTQGLIALDGTSFTGYSFVKPKAAEVSALAATENRLLIGTLDGGLFEYDGQGFSRRLNSTTGADFKRVTALLPFASRVYVGTQDLGLFIWREDRIEHIGPGDGLPSPHVTGIAPLEGSLSSIGEVAVATDFGVVALTGANQIKRISNKPNITSLAVSSGRLWAGLFRGGVVELHPEGAINDVGVVSHPVRSELPPSAEGAAGLPRSTPTVVVADEGKLWALTGEGAFSRDEGAAGPAFQSVSASTGGSSILTSGHITSLAFDGRGRLWIGYFDRGIDTVAPGTSERLAHFEDDRVREINSIRYDSGEEQMLAATSRGLVIFDDRSRQTVLTREHDGLINESVAHVLLADVQAPVAAGAAGSAAARPGRDQAVVLATAGGLTEVHSGRAHSITAFHGLPSNHLYCTAAEGSKLFVGSLAGLAVVDLDLLRVTTTYKTSNSHLSHDWVTAVCEADGTLYIGTNGGGVDALLSTGEWINFSDQIGHFEVNQNAMYFDGERLYIGTGQQGLLSYNTRGHRWTRFTSGLPSQNVTAIASDDRYIYAGTLNGMIRIEKRVLNGQ
jgi:ligand-binding sensor domain-containing protein